MKMTGKLEKMFSWEGLPSLCLSKTSKKSVDYAYLIPDFKRLLKLAEKVSKNPREGGASQSS